MLMLVLVFFIPGVYSVNVGISGSDDAGNSVGSTAEITATDEGSVNAQATLSLEGSASLSQSIEGTSGDLKESHIVQNKKKHHAEVSVNILGADYYCYDYTLYPGEGYGWSSNYVSAGESLTVQNADSITAEARASTANGYSAVAGISLYSPKEFYGTGCSVEDYSNYAKASDNYAMASQKMGAVESFGSIGLSESSSYVKNSAYHSLYASQGTLDCYSAKAEVTKSGGANVAADYKLLNALNAHDIATGSYDDISKNAHYVSSSGYDQYVLDPEYLILPPISLDAYSTKASSKGTATAASESLTGLTADDIVVRASASNNKGYTPIYTASAELSLLYGHGSVEDYSSYAGASDSNVRASQEMGPTEFYNLQLGESSNNIKNSASHRLYSSIGTLDSYSANADATKSGGANVAADYAQLNAEGIQDYTLGSYSDNLKNVYYASQVEYFGNSFNIDLLVGLSTYSAKASSKGTATTAKSTLQATGSPGIDYSINYNTYIFPLYNTRSLSIDSPGKYSAVAQFDGKKTYTDVAPVL